MLGSDIIQNLHNSTNTEIKSNKQEEYIRKDQVFDDSFSHTKLFFKNKINCCQLDDADEAWFDYKLRQKFV